MREEVEQILEEFKKDRGEIPEIYKSLAKENPDILRHYWGMRSAIMKGVLPKKLKELMILGICCAIGIEDSVEPHATAALSMGATKQEILETIEIAILFRGILGYATGMKALQIADRQAGRK
jgi:alkylhydroperoxidase/carboxymuconolactone decarboxylase family protein YurZ